MKGKIKFRVCRISFRKVFYLSFLMTLTALSANAELSLTNQWRIDQAKDRCAQVNDELIYKDYWGDTVKPENLNAVCMAEYFGELVAAEGDEWLTNKAELLIDQCKEESKRNQQNYFACLQTNLEQFSQTLSSPCVELHKEGLWFEDRCRRLVSYIFVGRFNKILESKKPFYERIIYFANRLKSNTAIRYACHPLTALVVFALYIFHFVFLVDPGNWVKTKKAAILMGSQIAAATIVEGGARIILSGLVMFISLGLIIWNHVAIQKRETNPFRKT